jgi:hypothetical protein
MKTIKLLISALLLSLGASVFGQTAIVDENFQSFKLQGWKSDTICGAKKIDSKANFKVTQTYGTTKVTYSFIKSAVTPDCETKKTPMAPGVTKGYVEVNKKEGEFIISEIKYISKIEVAASSTGDARGYALYKSVNGGEWVKVGEYLGVKSEGADAQYGFVKTIEINESNVSLKFVPTMGGTDEKEIRQFRIHNIKIFGK